MLSYIKEKLHQLVAGDADRQPAGVISNIPILCYHSWTVAGKDYQSNDHVAMESDLHTLSRRGYELLPLTTLVDVLRGKRPQKILENRRLVAITFDDGWDYDFRDWDSQEYGMVPSFRALLKRSNAFLKQVTDGPKAVAFVIASAEAREILARACDNGPGDWDDNWWAIAAEEGVVGIGNHGWDHVHENLPVVRQRDNKKGSFFAVDTYEDAEGQIDDAQKYIERITKGAQVPVFGYPFGHVPAYLRDEYFPQNGERLGIYAAFGTGGESVNTASNIWDLPRFVCGWHWKSPKEFETLLDAVERGER